MLNTNSAISLCKPQEKSVLDHCSPWILMTSSPNQENLAAVQNPYR